MPSAQDALFKATMKTHSYFNVTVKGSTYSINLKNYAHVNHQYVDLNHAEKMIAPILTTLTNSSKSPFAFKLTCQKQKALKNVFKYLEHEQSCGKVFDGSKSKIAKLFARMCRILASRRNLRSSSACSSIR